MRRGWRWMSAVGLVGDEFERPGMEFGVWRIPGTHFTMARADESSFT